MTAHIAHPLPDLLLAFGGILVRSAGQWPRRRSEIQQLTLPLLYGDLPPPPASTCCIDLHAAVVRRLDGARLLSCRVQTEGRHAFLMRVFVPARPGPFPVILNGDGCWHYASDAVIAAVLARGYVFAQFNRVEIAPDMAAPASPTGNRGHVDYVPALAAWAWGYHRAVDALLQKDFVDVARIAIVGHSRGGKAALLAGATDERIAVTSANNSGAGGAGCFRWQGSGSETLAEVVATFPHWFGPRLAHYSGRESELPFDQHFVKALIAPRALLTTEALDDHWANPAGSWLTHRAARAAYALLGAQDRIAIAFRPGGHDHGMDDWITLLDFCDYVFQTKPRPNRLDVNPFPDLQQAFIAPVAAR